MTGIYHGDQDLCHVRCVGVINVCHYKFDAAAYGTLPAPRCPVHMLVEYK